jgi:hypothetical protein
MKNIGLSNSSVIDSIKILQKKNIIEFKGYNKNGKIYSLIFNENEKSS